MKKLLLLLTLSLNLFAVDPAIGVYGGLFNTSSTEAGNGHYAITEKANRKFFRDPQGHLFFGLQVYWGGAQAYEPYRANIIAKYGGVDQWTAAQPARFRNLWLNSLADDTVTSGLLGMNGGLPFSRSLNASDYAMRTTADGGGSIKNVYAGNTNFGDYVGEAADMYDPAYNTYVIQLAAYDNYGTNVLPTTPWLISIATDDADFVFGVKDGPGVDCGTLHYHAAYMVARANPYVNSYIGPNVRHTQTYTDKKLYTKYAWRDYLKSLPQYQTGGVGDITKLNTAWGSNYTTWDCTNMSGANCAGTSWGTGTGLLDENGSSSWLGTNAYTLSGADADFVIDANNFLYEMWRKYTIVVTNAIRAYTPNAIVVSPAALAACTRTQILQAMSSEDPTRPGLPLLDVMEIGGTWTLDNTKLTAIYDLTGLPQLLWTSYLGNAESSLSAYSCSAWGQLCLATQALRGSAYASVLSAVTSLQGANGKNFVIGMRWWQGNDNWNEKSNFGLFSLKDNAYNGVENVTGSVSCNTVAGLTCGGESTGGGDFLGAMVTANKTLLSGFESTYYSPLPEGANKALTKPVSVSTTYTEGCASCYVKEKGVDGNVSTRWSSLYNDAETYTVDLINTYNINSVTIEWTIASPAQYNILVSTNGTDWTQVATRSGLSAATDHQRITDTFASTSTRFVKFEGVDRASIYGYSFYEMEVYATNPPPSEVPGPVIPSNITVSGSVVLAQ